MEKIFQLLENARENDFIKGIVGWVDFQVSDIQQKLSNFSQFKAIKGFRHILQG